MLRHAEPAPAPVIALVRRLDGTRVRSALLHIDLETSKTRVLFKGRVTDRLPVEAQPAEKGISISPL